MGSREKLAALNRRHTSFSETEETNKPDITDTFIEGISKAEQKEEATPVIQDTPMKSQDLPPKNDFINVIDKSHVGRPKKLEGTYKAISARLKMENYVFARKEGAMYGGMNAYINYLIEKDLKRKSKNR